MKLVPPPDINELLIPVIACLPTAFISPQPPPALLPYLSPILRQRLSLLSANPPPASRSSNTHSDSNWLHLLTWSSAHARRLNEIVSNLQLEPHPVSGELELFEEDLDGEQGKIKYRRTDAETLQAKCDVAQHGLSVVWVWCTNDTGGVGLENANNGQAKDGWRVAEVIPCEEEDTQEGAQLDTSLAWFDTIEAADEAALSRAGFMDVAEGQEDGEDRVLRNGASTQDDDEDDDDDDYWAAYDRTPAARTPAKRSPGPMSSMGGLGMTAAHNGSDERDYFERYGSEVQPAMDAHDPDEAQGASEIDSTLQDREAVAPSLGQQASTSNATLDGQSSTRQAESQVKSPSPSRPASPREQSPVARLEASAQESSVAEMGVKQHISTEMKSLYRLARNTGIERAEFERVVRRELEVLELMEY